MTQPRGADWVFFLTLVSGLGLAGPTSRAQDRLKAVPGYERFKAVGDALPDAVKSGAVRGTWREGGRAFAFDRDGRSYSYDLPARELFEAGFTDRKAPSGLEPPRRRRPSSGVERGRQHTSATSPDGKLKASYRDRNLYLGDASGALESALTTDGSASARIKSGTASWVYGEELYQDTAIWWSPDSRKVAFYRFDESAVKDYYLTLEQGKVQDALDVEPYTKVGTPNPVVDLLIYDLATRKTTRVDVRSGQPFADGVLGHYVYRVSWSADGKALLFNRTNRRQDTMEFVAADPATGATRVVVRESWPESWVENSPAIRFLADGRRFLWASERTGWRNYYLYDLDGTLLNPVTSHESDVGDLVRVDEIAGQVWYYARTGDNPMKLQLHRVGLDGKGDRRLTDPAFLHAVDVAPDGKHFVDVFQAHDLPPASRLVDSDGTAVADLAASDLTKADALKLRRVELFTFKAADGKTDLSGMLQFPSDFDPGRRYPLLVTVYAGPATNGAHEAFTLPDPMTELGFLVASFDSRSAGGRGKRALDAIYLKFGRPEMDDQAEGVKSLRDRPYVDGSRVGIFGTSYGGTAAAACLMRFPDVFHAAVANSAVTDFRNYDTIYTERYMRTPPENPEGYDFARVMTHAPNLKGRLLIYYGTADNNVHPSNSLQLIKALQDAGKSFDVQVGPDQGHTAVRRERMLEFFLDTLAPPPPVASKN